MSPKYTVYVLQSRKDGEFYIGHTDNLRARLARHHSGGVRATGHRGLYISYLRKFFPQEKKQLCVKDGSSPVWGENF